MALPPMTDDAAVAGGPAAALCDGGGYAGQNASAGLGALRLAPGLLQALSPAAAAILSPALARLPPAKPLGGSAAGGGGGFAAERFSGGDAAPESAGRRQPAGKGEIGAIFASGGGGPAPGSGGSFAGSGGSPGAGKARGGCGSARRAALRRRDTESTSATASPGAASLASTPPTAASAGGGGATLTGGGGGAALSGGGAAKSGAASAVSAGSWGCFREEFRPPFAQFRSGMQSAGGEGAASGEAGDDDEETELLRAILDPEDAALRRRAAGGGAVAASAPSALAATATPPPPAAAGAGAPSAAWSSASGHGSRRARRASSRAAPGTPQPGPALAAALATALQTPAPGSFGAALRSGFGAQFTAEGGKSAGNAGTPGVQSWVATWAQAGPGGAAGGGPMTPFSSDAGHCSAGACRDDYCRAAGRGRAERGWLAAQRKLASQFGSGGARDSIADDAPFAVSSFREEAEVRCESARLFGSGGGGGGGSESFAGDGSGGFAGGGGGGGGIGGHGSGGGFAGGGGGSFGHGFAAGGDGSFGHGSFGHAGFAGGEDGSFGRPGFAEAGVASLDFAGSGGRRSLIKPSRISCRELRQVMPVILAQLELKRVSRKGLCKQLAGRLYANSPKPSPNFLLNTLLPVYRAAEALGFCWERNGRAEGASLSHLRAWVCQQKQGRALVHRFRVFYNAPTAKDASGDAAAEREEALRRTWGQCHTTIFQQTVTGSMAPKDGAAASGAAAEEELKSDAAELGLRSAELGLPSAEETSGHRLGSWQVPPPPFSAPPPPFSAPNLSPPDSSCCQGRPCPGQLNESLTPLLFAPPSTPAEASVATEPSASVSSFPHSRNATARDLPKRPVHVHPSVEPHPQTSREKKLSNNVERIKVDFLEEGNEPKECRRLFGSGAVPVSGAAPSLSAAISGFPKSENLPTPAATTHNPARATQEAAAGTPPAAAGTPTVAHAGAAGAADLTPEALSAPPPGSRRWTAPPGDASAPPARRTRPRRTALPPPPLPPSSRPPLRRSSRLSRTPACMQAPAS